MAFRFPLEAVFHFRKSVEHQQELRLRSANQQVARLRRALDQLDEGMRQVHARENQELSVGTTAAELRFALSSEQSIRQQRREVEREMVRLENLRDQQQRIFRQARRERETFESLREQQFREYERGAVRREQRQLDEIFLLRQAFARRQHG